MEKEIEDYIGLALIESANKNALEFVVFLRANEMQFTRCKGYWEDKLYWAVNYNDKSVCYILISDEEKKNPHSWTIWSDDSGSTWFKDFLLDEQLKDIAWKNVDICGNVNGVCGGCAGKIRKKIFGKDFDNVCGTTFRFDNPESETMECIKKLIELRKTDILIDENVSVVEYNPNWVTQFNNEKTLLQQYFPNMPIEHIGSTSVNGMTAKPIVDILIAISNFPPQEEMVAGLEQLGYFHFGPHNTQMAHYYFVKRGTENYNVHLCGGNGDSRWHDQIGLRDFLRNNPDIALKYSDLKKSIIDRGINTMLGYWSEKNEFFTEIMKKVNTHE